MSTFFAKNGFQVFAAVLKGIMSWRKLRKEQKELERNAKAKVKQDKIRVAILVAKFVACKRGVPKLPPGECARRVVADYERTHGEPLTALVERLRQGPDADLPNDFDIVLGALQESIS